MSWSTCQPKSSKSGSRQETPPSQDGRKTTVLAKQSITLPKLGITSLLGRWHKIPTLGNDSGNNILAILKKNPKKTPEKYDQGMFITWRDCILFRWYGVRKIWCGNSDDIHHMRRVVSYCKRHLVQEENAKKDTGSKSYKSLKNWGHDAQNAWVPS